MDQEPLFNWNKFAELNQNLKFFFIHWHLISRFFFLMLVSNLKVIKTVSKWMSLYKWPLLAIFWPYVCTIFHKTEVLTVILRCLKGLTYDWFKSHDTKHKYFHCFFLVILTKTDICMFCVFCVFVFFVIIFVPIKV